MRHGHGRLRSARLGVRAAAAAALAISVLVSAGCGSESHAAEQQTVDLTKLDTGNYPTKPTSYTPTDADRAARTAEALRLGSAMPLPMEIDPALTHAMAGPHPFTSVESFEGDPFLIVLDNEHFAANTPGLVAGFAAAAQSDTAWEISYSLRNAVMIFDSEDAANSAATALAHSGFARTESTDAPEPAPSTRYPTAQVIWLPSHQVLASFYATGKFVIVTVVRNSENSLLKVSDQPGLLGLSDKAITATVDRLKTFQPTPKDKLADLPLDPQGLLRLTLPVPKGDVIAYTYDGTLDKHAALLTVGDSAKSQARFDKAGVDYVSYGAAQLIRARDADAAVTLLQERSHSKFERRIESPSALPIAQCFKVRTPNSEQFAYHCYFTYGRYSVEILAAQQQDAYQRISAQYAMLANDK
ncbi:DUF7373 family lipoprotein [Nocardia sp. NPDC004340]